MLQGAFLEVVESCKKTFHLKFHQQVKEGREGEMKREDDLFFIFPFICSTCFHYLLIPSSLKEKRQKDERGSIHEF